MAGAIPRPSTGPLWWDATAAPSSAGEVEVPQAAEVVVVGAGYTGLWTAYYLSQAEPSLRIVVVEAEVVCENADQLITLLNSRIRNLDGVQTTETFVYLKLQKQFYNWGTR